MTGTILLEDGCKYLLSPIIAAALVYWFGNKSKKQDIDNQKTKELNIILANMLNCLFYLNKLSEVLKFSEDQKDDLLFPIRFLPFIVLKSETLNDNCFNELDNSIEMLKQYDPISHFELEGIGRKIDYVKKTYIIPFVENSNKDSVTAQKFSITFLDKLSDEIEEKIKHTAKLISNETLKKVEKKIEQISVSNNEEMRQEFNQEYYQFVLSILPNDVQKPTIDGLLEAFKDPEIRIQIETEFEFIAKNGMQTLTNLIAQNPDVTIEQLQQNLNNGITNANQ